MLEILLYCAAFGVISGILSGLLGIGGGIIIVPFIAWLLTHHGMPAESIMQTAVATSLATIITTSISAVWAQHRRGAINWPVFITLTPGIAIGAWFGADLAHMMTSEVLAMVFGSFLVLNGARMFINLKTKTHRELPGALSVPPALYGGQSSRVWSVRSRKRKGWDRSPFRLVLTFAAMPFIYLQPNNKS